MSLLQSVWNFIVAVFGLLLTNVELGAVAVGTLAAISITQVAKMLVIQFAPTNGGKGLWYIVATAIGFAVTAANWPTILGASWGLAVGGLFAPALYVIATRILYRFFPDAEAVISATPKVRD